MPLIRPVRFVLCAATLALLPPLLTAQAEAAATCQGLAVTNGCRVNGSVGPCKGTSGNDLIVGTSGPDVIHAKGGHDRVLGRGGKDIICGGGGDDLVFGGGGADSIDGNGGDDDLRGEGGGDTIDGGGGSGDVVNGGKGNDACLDPGFATFSQCEFFDGDDDGFAENEDCDDEDPNNFPGNAEVCDGQDNNCDGAIDDGPLDTIDEFLACVELEDAQVHLEAFQGFADASGGTRASGTPGYDASADYVASLLEDAGLIVERQTFDHFFFTENSISLTANAASIATRTMRYSGSGVVTGGNVIPVDLDLGLGNSSTSGCEVSDFAGPDWSGSADIALIQRGACAFGAKAINAVAAGAEAVIIFNQGNTADPGRQGIIGGTLGEGVVGIVDIPVLDTSYSDGLVVLGAATVDLAADTTIVTSTTENIIADLPGINPDNVAMAGAHLDSVQAGPGIQDNGSGSAVLLAVALELSKHNYTPQNTLRFAWWGAEESGLIGSNEYVFNPVFGLTQAEYDALALYLNFDMVASPNYIYGVYDADESTFPAPVFVPPGSEALEDLFEAFYSIEGLPYEDSAFSGRSDYQAFIDVGIPAGGLFTGAEGVKTSEQESIWGGTAGDAYDPCYHLACDTVDNPSQEALDVNIDAVAYAIFNVAASTEAVNGVVGVEAQGITPDEVVFDGPQGTFLGGGGMEAGDGPLGD